MGTKLTLSPEAATRYDQHYNAFNAVKASLSEPLQVVWPKLRGYALRFVILLHALEAAEKGSALPTQVGVDTVDRAWELVNYFLAAARWVCEQLTMTEKDQKYIRVWQAITRRAKDKDGVFTKNQVFQDVRGNRKLFPDIESLDSVLVKLVHQGRIQKVEGKKPGASRPSERYRMTRSSKSSKP
jgi:hypothetical protein